jgi:hypothetical protein
VSRRADDESTDEEEEKLSPFYWYHENDEDSEDDEDEEDEEESDEDEERAEEDGALPQEPRGDASSSGQGDCEVVGGRGGCARAAAEGLGIGEGVVSVGLQGPQGVGCGHGAATDASRLETSVLLD